MHVIFVVIGTCNRLSFPTDLRASSPPEQHVSPGHTICSYWPLSSLLSDQYNKLSLSLSYFLSLCSCQRLSKTKQRVVPKTSQHPSVSLSKCSVDRTLVDRDLNWQQLTTDQTASQGDIICLQWVTMNHIIWMGLNTSRSLVHARRRSKMNQMSALKHPHWEKQEMGN